MRIGVYVSAAAVQRGYERNVSGHIQIPMRALELLRDAGHDARLITNWYDDSTHTLPECAPKGITTHLIDDARVRGSVHEKKGAHRRGLRISMLRRQVGQLQSICRDESLDILHLYGVNRTAHLGGALKLLGVKIPIVCTMFRADFPERFGFLTRRLWNRVDALVTATAFVQRQMQSVGLDATIVRHGIVRDLRTEVEDETVNGKSRVLFWRDPSRNNGADVCATVYDALAPKHPDIHFDMAIRPHWAEVEGLDDLAARHENVTIFRFPYEKGITLPKLVLESLCVLLPFRRMTICPQLAIAESLAVGVPVVATDLWSNNELIEPGRNGDLVPIDDVDATIGAVERVIQDRNRALQMGRDAAVDLRSQWNWDQYVDDIMAVYTSCTPDRGT